MDAINKALALCLRDAVSYFRDINMEKYLSRTTLARVKLWEAALEDARLQGLREFIKDVTTKADFDGAAGRIPLVSTGQGSSRVDKQEEDA